MIAQYQTTTLQHPNQPFEKASYPTQTNQSPIVSFRRNSKCLVIKGSFNVNHPEAFQKTLPLIVSDYFKTEDKLTCYFHIKALNHETTKIVMDLFSLFSEKQKEGKTTVVNWFADWYKEDLLETGSDLSDLFDVPVNILPL